MRCVPALFLLMPLIAPAMQAADVRDLRFGLAVDETTCTIRRPSASFDAGEQQIFLRFIARSLRAGDRLQIDWVAPDGEAVSTVPYDELPASSQMCFISVLPVAGYQAGSEPGQWRARVSVNGEERAVSTFTIKGSSGPLRITQVSYSGETAATARIAVQATGMRSMATINIARYRAAGGWEYVAHALPDSTDGRNLSAAIQTLPPGQYYAILRCEDGQQSPPSAFQVATGSVYRLPALYGETWRITQGPFGSYSHWGRAIHAWDVAPSTSRIVAAMRPGAVSAHDRGLGQTPRSRSFGNYITIDHGDGEYSHYAHLKTGTFRVRTGERVDSGQALADAGTSGYSFGVHLHVHVTRSNAIAAMSIPFRFAELPENSGRGFRGAIISRNSPTGLVTPVSLQPQRLAARAPKWQASVPFAQWWSKTLAVPRKARSIEIRHGWTDPALGFDLYLVSPSGKKYPWESARKEEPLKVPSPEPGTWSVWVQAVQGGGGDLPFWVDALVR